MTWPPGSRLGSYEIRAAIGAGGMGEVYRATDTNLGRAVAIKVLPAAFAHDPERLARFEREAKALAALNHPHIAQIYGSRTRMAHRHSSWSWLTAKSCRGASSGGRFQSTTRWPSHVRSSTRSRPRTSRASSIAI